MILNRLSMAMTFSQMTRWLEMARFLALSVVDNGCFLLRFLACRFVHGASAIPDSRYQLGLWLQGEAELSIS